METHAPKKAVQAFEKAVDAVSRAPRTHAEGSLKRADAHLKLLKAGREAPWFEAALELLDAR